MVARKSRPARKSATKLSPVAAEQLAERILAELEHFTRKAAARKQEVALLSKPALIRKLRGQTSHSPFISSISWNPVGARGSTISAAVGVVNPDPNTYLASELFAHAFWGPGNVLTDLDSFILSADPAFPRFAVGIQAAPNPPLSFGSIDIPLPTAVAAGTYLTNWLLFLRNPFGVGTFLERAGAYTTLT
jgi:hypothetical protein